MWWGRFYPIESFLLCKSAHGAHRSQIGTVTQSLEWLILPTRCFQPHSRCTQKHDKQVKIKAALIRHEEIIDSHTHANLPHSHITITLIQFKAFHITTKYNCIQHPGFFRTASVLMLALEKKVICITNPILSPPYSNPCLWLVRNKEKIFEFVFFFCPR